MAETCQITVTSVICPQKAGRLHPDISRSAHRYTSSQLHTVNCKIKNVKLVYRYFVTERTLTKFNPTEPNSNLTQLVLGADTSCYPYTGSLV